MAGAAPIGPASALVRRAHARWRRLRALEAGLLALCAALVTLAAAVLSGASAAAASSCAAALVSALACAAAWYHERRLEERELARRLDPADGLLSTAWEHEQRARLGGPLHAVLHARLRALLSSHPPASLLSRAAPAPAPVLFLLPLAALALCAWMLELAPARGRGPQLLLLAEALAEGVGTLASEPAADPAATERVAMLARRVAESAGQARVGPSLRAVEAELQALIAGLPEGTAARAALERARELASVLGAEPSAARSAVPGGAGSATGGAAALAPGPADRTMGGSLPAPAGAREPAPAAERRSPEAGTAAGRFWPEHYDAVVSGWLERRRTARSEHQDTGIGREQR